MKNKNIKKYCDQVASNISKSISYSVYVAENVNKTINFPEYWTNPSNKLSNLDNPDINNNYDNSEKSMGAFYKEYREEFIEFEDLAEKILATYYSVDYLKLNENKINLGNIFGYDKQK